MGSIGTVDSDYFDDDMGTPPTPRRNGLRGKQKVRRPRANTCIGQVQPGGLSDTTGRRNMSTPPRAGAHLPGGDSRGRSNSAGGNGDRKEDRPRPKSTTPETAASKKKKEDGRRSPLKLFTPSTARFIELSKRLFARVLGDRNALTPELRSEEAAAAEALADSDRVASRCSLPARMEDLDEREPLIATAAPPPAEPKLRFPCVQCHAPESACWNFLSQTPTKCTKCMSLDNCKAANPTPTVPADRHATVAASNDGGENAADAEESTTTQSEPNSPPPTPAYVPELGMLAELPAATAEAAPAELVAEKDARLDADADIDAGADIDADIDAGADSAVAVERAAADTAAAAAKTKMFDAVLTAGSDDANAGAGSPTAAQEARTMIEMLRRGGGAPPKMGNLDDVVTVAHVDPQAQSSA